MPFTVRRGPGGAATVRLIVTKLKAFYGTKRAELQKQAWRNNRGGLVHKWNRLARTVARFESFMLEMKLAGVDVVSLDGQSNATATPAHVQPDDGGLFRVPARRPGGDHATGEDRPGQEG